MLLRDPQRPARPTGRPGALGAALRARLLAGPLGTLLFLLTVALAGAHREGYDAWREPISALSLGPGGGWSRLEMLLFAGCVAAFGQALAHVMPRHRPGWCGRWASRAVLGAAAARFVLGLCVMDDVSYGDDGALVGRHTLEGGVHIGALVAGWLLRVDRGPA